MLLLGTNRKKPFLSEMRGNCRRGNLPSSYPLKPLLVLAKISQRGLRNLALFSIKGPLEFNFASQSLPFLYSEHGDSWICVICSRARPLLLGSNKGMEHPIPYFIHWQMPSGLAVLLPYSEWTKAFGELFICVVFAF